jgi:hypothetical protein
MLLTQLIAQTSSRSDTAANSVEQYCSNGLYYCPSDSEGRLVAPKQVVTHHFAYYSMVHASCCSCGSAVSNSISMGSRDSGRQQRYACERRLGNNMHVGRRASSDLQKELSTGCSPWTRLSVCATSLVCPFPNRGIFLQLQPHPTSALCVVHLAGECSCRPILACAA